MLAQVQMIALELKTLRNEKGRICSVPQPLRLRIVALAHKYSLKEVASACALHYTTVFKWPEYLNRVPVPLQPKIVSPLSQFTVTQLPPPSRSSSGVVTLMRADGVTLTLPADSVLAEKAVALFLEGC